MKFLIDMPLSPELVSWLEQRQHDAIHAVHVGLDQASDGLILFRGGNYSESEMRALLERVFQTVPVEELQRSIVVVDRRWIRRRRLPIS